MTTRDGGDGLFALDEILEAIRSLREPEPTIASVLVASDVWDRLRATIPTCIGSRLLASAGVDVRRCDWLDAGQIVPLDQYGNPLPRPPKK